MYLSKAEKNRYGLAWKDYDKPIAFTGYKIMGDIAYMCCPWDLFGIRDEALISNQIFVFPDYRGRGLGGLLIGKLCEVARDRGHRILKIDRPKEDLVSWYDQTLDFLVNSSSIRGYVYRTEIWNRFLVEL